MADTPLETSIKSYAWGRIDSQVARDMRSTARRFVVRERLAGMVDSLHDQLEDRPDDHDWRGGALRLLGKLEDMLAEFDALCDEEAMRLREAIEHHRHEILASGYSRSSEEVDEELWAVLDA